MKKLLLLIAACLMFAGPVLATTYTETYSEPATGVRKIGRRVIDSDNTVGAIVMRDVSGNFTAGTITADTTGSCSGTSATFTGSLTGDVTSTAMATTIAAASVESGMLANGAGVASLLTAGLGNSASYVTATTGAQTLNVSDTDARVVIGMVIIDEVFANGDDAQPTFSIGETDSLTKFAATNVFTDAAAGAVFTFAGTLTANKALIITATAGTGTTETGGLSVTTLILDAE